MKKLLILSLATVALFSCKKETTETATTPETPSAPTIEAPVVEAPENAGVVKLEITGDDQMKFDKSKLTVPAGSQVELTLHHSGKMSAETMGHNWTLLKKGTDIKDFGMEALSAKENDYIPEGTDAVIVHTKLIGGGESITITFDAPEKGVYDYICTFPGHFGSMQGKFVVE